LWYVGPQLALLVASEERLAIDWARLVQRSGQPEVKADLALADLSDPAALVARLLMEGPAIESYTGGGQIVTDDRPLGFWQTAARLPREKAAALTERLLERKQSAADYLVNVPEPERPVVAAAVERAERAARIVIRARATQAAGDWGAAARQYETALAIDPGDASARRGAARAYNRLGEHLLLSNRLSSAETLLRKSIYFDPAFWQPHVGLAKCLERQGRLAEALAAYKRANELCPELGLPIAQMEAALGPQR